MIEFDGEFELDESPDVMWPYFTDPDVLADAAPGMKSMELASPSEVEAVMSVSVGSVSPEFRVDATVTEADAPVRLEGRAVGNAPRSAFETVATMELSETDEGGTLAKWSARAEVSGLVASLGQRALGGVTERLVNNFFDDLQAAAESGEPAESRLEAAPDAEATLDPEDGEADEGEADEGEAD